jgi:phage regulator Rha-like protein
MSVYLFRGEKGKRDSIIVVAQLSPEFTARLVDRWNELEAAQHPVIPQSFSDALRLAADLKEQRASVARTGISRTEG